MTPSDFVPDGSTTDWLEVGWSALALYGIYVAGRLFVRFHGRISWMAREKIDGDLGRRARGLRRHALLHSVVMFLNLAIGYWAMLTPPPVNPSVSALTLGAGAVWIATTLLLVVGLKLEERDVSWLEAQGARRDRRVSDRGRVAAGGRDQ